jgi:hypothetical protein
MRPLVLAGVAAGVAMSAFASLRYRRDMNAARARLAAVDRHVIPTPWGPVEYAERGHGEPVLVYRSVSIRVSRIEHPAERDTSSPSRRAHRFARRTRHWPD